MACNMQHTRIFVADDNFGCYSPRQARPALADIKAFWHRVGQDIANHLELPVTLQQWTAVERSLKVRVVKSSLPVGTVG